MQIEKYIYYLSKTGKTGERSLNETYLSDLPKGISLKITNPKGMIIMGRNTLLSKEQRHDFEIIKRKYKNTIDILTYDELLKRLNVTIEQESVSKTVSMNSLFKNNIIDNGNREIRF